MDIKEIVTAEISFIIWQGCTKISSGCKYCNMFRSKASKNEEIFTNIKSFKFLQLQNYLNISDFIESEPYQVHIFGHSCGLSVSIGAIDTLTEHGHQMIGWVTDKQGIKTSYAWDLTGKMYGWNLGNYTYDLFLVMK